MHQHRWMAEWEPSGPADGWIMKACEDCGAELVALATVRGRGRSARRSEIVSLVYIAPCPGR